MSGRIDIIFCYRDRDLQRVKHCLDSLALQTNTDFLAVFVDYGSEPKVSEEIKTLTGKYHFCHYHFVDTTGKMWNRSDAINHGFYFSDAPFVFTSDIDLVFKKNFVETLHRMKDEHKAIFFSVGYLDKKNTEQLNLNALVSVPFSKSERFALGMALLPKEIIKKVNGYNNFYALWGLEDNDLKLRLESAGVKTNFVEEVLMLHQFHPPVNKSGSLPDGWIQFMKDYHDNYSKHLPTFDGFAQVEFPPKRPAKAAISNESDFKEIKGRKLFTRHTLINEFVNANQGAVLKFVLKPNVSSLTGSTVFRLGRGLSKFFKSLGLDLAVESRHRSQYTFMEDLQEEVLFFLKTYEARIKDYYYEGANEEIKLVIVKK